MPDPRPPLPLARSRRLVGSFIAFGAHAAAIVSAAPSGILLHRWGARRVVAALALCAITLAMVGRASGGGLGAVPP
jgi:hypothetical protein